MAIDLSGQISLVTGASSGLGLAIAQHLAAAGAAVMLNYHAHGDAAEHAAADIVAAGGRARAFKADVSHEDEVQALFAETVREWGALDILVANSGIQKDAPVAEMSLADWNFVIALNLTGEFLCAREAIRQFRLQGRRPRSRALGKILCMSSVHELGA